MHAPVGGSRQAAAIVRAVTLHVCCCVQVVLATGEGNLVCLDVADNKLTEKAHVKLNGEVSCIDITPLGDPERSQSGRCGHLGHAGKLTPMLPATASRLKIATLLLMHASSCQCA